MVVAAYEQTGMKPIRGHFFLSGDVECACGLGVMYRNTATAELIGESPFAVRSYSRDLYGIEYTRGFIHGFDGEKDLSDVYRGSECGYRYSEGYIDGQAAWEAVKGKADSEEE